jgi:sirohydrochlorin ferrochelatase
VTKPTPPRLLIAAHGTESPVGSATTAALTHAVAAARPDVPVALCFLDVVAPSLTEALDAEPGPTVVVPLLLSTGYHVQSDIPAAVAGRQDVRVARHLGPDPALTDALAERLAEARGAASPNSTVLVGIGSSRSEARAELEECARQLSVQLGRDVAVLTMLDDLRAAFAALPDPAEVATYLLADGHFLTKLRAAAEGLAIVAEPLGVHPTLVELVLRRYDEARLGGGVR